jgi:hypothetical protein
VTDEPHPFEGYDIEEVEAAWRAVRQREAAAGTPGFTPWPTIGPAAPPPPAPVIDAYPSGLAGMRAYCRANPMTYLAIGFLGAIAAPAVFIIGMAGLLLWYELFG